MGHPAHSPFWSLTLLTQFLDSSTSAWGLAGFPQATCFLPEVNRIVTLVFWMRLLSSTTVFLEERAGWKMQSSAAGIAVWWNVPYRFGYLVPIGVTVRLWNFIGFLLKEVKGPWVWALGHCSPSHFLLSSASAPLGCEEVPAAHSCCAGVTCVRAFLSMIAMSLQTVSQTQILPL